MAAFCVAALSRLLAWLAWALLCSRALIWSTDRSSVPVMLGLVARHSLPFFEGAYSVLGKNQRIPSGQVRGLLPYRRLGEFRSSSNLFCSFGLEIPLASFAI